MKNNNKIRIPKKYNLTTTLKNYLDFMVKKIKEEKEIRKKFGWMSEIYIKTKELFERDKKKKF